MKVWSIALAAALAAISGSEAANTPKSNAPKGCYEKAWSKAELKKLPLQEVVSLRLEANLGDVPENKPQAFGRLMARFRDTGDEWLATQFECSDTGAGFACAAYCDGNVFVLSAGGGALAVMPQQGVMLAGPDCSGSTASLKMNADQMPFTLSRRGGKACPTR